MSAVSREGSFILYYFKNLVNFLQKLIILKTNFWKNNEEIYYINFLAETRKIINYIG
jgi:hypothetical protein